MKEKWIVGVDLGGTSIKLAFVSQDGDVIEKWGIPTDLSKKGTKILPNIASSILEKLSEKNLTLDHILGVGIGAPGSVEFETGIIHEGVNLGWTEPFSLVEELRKHLNAPNLLVVADNDANVAALGEKWKGAGDGASDVVFVTLGTGVGGGVIVDNKLVHGSIGAAGEIGHITVKPEHGHLCNCGKKGCLETISSATAIARIAYQHVETTLKESMLHKHKKTGAIECKDVFDYAKQGDFLATEIVNEVSFYLGLALSNIGNILNPHKIVIGGGVSNAGDTLLAPVEEYFKHFSFPSVAKSTKLSIATLGNTAGVIGAAGLVKDAL